MSRMAEIQSELGKLSEREKLEIRDWLENILEDQLEMREEFKATLERTEWDMAAGRPSRIRRGIGTLTGTREQAKIQS
jgi:GTPase SAR1 family protein